MDWISIIEDDYSTYPNEGIPVVVSDGESYYETAWFLMSGEYKWKKDDIRNDISYNFDLFTIVKWKYIDE